MQSWWRTSEIGNQHYRSPNSSINAITDFGLHETSQPTALMRAGALGILDEDFAAKVAKAYFAYREQQHLARNNNQLKTWVAVGALSEERHAVMTAWSTLLR